MNKICVWTLVCVCVGFAAANDAQAMGRKKKKNQPVPPAVGSTYPTAELVGASNLRFPAEADSNSPMFWADGLLHVFNSSRNAKRSTGTSIYALGSPEPVSWEWQRVGDRWVEAIWRTSDGDIYGWYHNEPTVCPGLASPQIGAARSFDNGRTWIDLGIVLKAPEGTDECDSRNKYFSGGLGDPSVMLDSQGEYLYFFFGNYAGPVEQQGAGVARMAWADRDEPEGKVWKWHQGAWSEPGLGGALSPIFRADVPTQRQNAFHYWGPSIHWNTYLNQYVILLNRAQGFDFHQEGVYVSFTPNLADPNSWSPATKILNGGRWYPQVVGDVSIQGTDKLAGERARFFMLGESNYEIRFRRPTTNSAPSSRATSARAAKRPRRR